MPERVGAAIFDCDGLLVDTASCWHRAFEITLQSRGRALTDTLKVQLNGASVRSAAAILRIPANDIAVALARTIATSRLTPLTGVEGLLNSLLGRIPLAVATNAPLAVTKAVLAAAGLDGIFQLVVSAESLHDKPAPDVYLAACRAVAVPPSRAVAFEDSPVGLAAARKAGLITVYVPSNPAIQADADLEIPDLEDPRLSRLLSTHLG
jgi:HAD superfamily hydrolase (TIGR01509 family)